MTFVFDISLLEVNSRVGLLFFFVRSLISPNDEHDSYFKCWFLFVKWPISEGWKFEVARWFLSHAIAFRMLMETKREPLDGTHTHRLGRKMCVQSSAEWQKYPKFTWMTRTKTCIELNSCRMIRQTKTRKRLKCVVIIYLVQIYVTES